jgi:hypothetical protein
MNRFARVLPLLALLCLFALSLTGCGLLDTFFLGDPTDPTSVSNPPAKQFADAISVLIPVWGPISATALTGFGWLYAHLRGKKRESAFPALVLDIINAVMAAKGGTLNYDLLYTTLKDATTLFANKDKFVKLVDDVQASLKQVLADGFQPEDIGKVVDAVKADFVDVAAIPSAPAAPVAPAAPAPEAPAAPSA